MATTLVTEAFYSPPTPIDGISTIFLFTYNSCDPSTTLLLQVMVQMTSGTTTSNSNMIVLTQAGTYYFTAAFSPTTSILTLIPQPLSSGTYLSVAWDGQAIPLTESGQNQVSIFVNGKANYLSTAPTITCPGGGTPPCQIDCSSLPNGGAVPSITNVTTILYNFGDKPIPPPIEWPFVFIGFTLQGYTSCDCHAPTIALMAQTLSKDGTKSNTNIVLLGSGQSTFYLQSATTLVATTSPPAGFIYLQVTWDGSTIDKALNMVVIDKLANYPINASSGQVVGSLYTQCSSLVNGGKYCPQPSPPGPPGPPNGGAGGLPGWAIWALVGGIVLAIALAIIFIAVYHHRHSG